MIPATCSVILPIPAAHPYRYRIPTALADRIVPGARVVVPVRARELVGVVEGLSGEPPAAELKSVLLAPDEAPLVPPSLLALGVWVSRYYAAPPGLAFRTMLPPALWGASRLVARLVDAAAAGNGGAGRQVVEALERSGGRAAAPTLARRLKRPVWDALQRLARAGAIELSTEPADLGPGAGTVRVLRLSRTLPSLLERDRAFGRAARQRALYEALDAQGGEANAEDLATRLGFTDAVQRGLVSRGLATVERREALRDPFRDVAAAPPGDPTPAQREAIERLAAVPAGQAAVLYGVTGSGKTLVYLEAIRRVVELGHGAIVLVPEISLTPQTVARVRGVFGDRVAVLHSALSEAERADAWRAVAGGRRRVVVGARSAVFAPVERLGLIVVDEEHDASYKQGETPRYHARDVALARARRESARVVLGSATPSLETWATRTQRLVVRLPDRVAARPMPPVRLVDLRHEARVLAAGPVPWSEALDGAVAARLAAGRQVILLLNRRGFAHYLQCEACGVVRECRSCSIALTVHSAPAALRCHYCGHQEPVPAACPECGGATQRTRGVGTQQLERWLGERYPTARIARMDADTTSTKWSHGKLLDAFGRGEIDILFGTQMIAKGLDFPGVTLVGVVDADNGLHLPDFRSAERTFQLVAQVAGRAGRGPDGGEVLVQTRAPGHYALVAAAAHDFEGFAEKELEVRRTPAYPPHVALVNAVVSGSDETAVAAAAVQVADWLRGLVAARAAGRVEIVGPAPAPLARIKERWRWHMVLRAADRRWLGRTLRYAARRAPWAGGGRGTRPVRLTFDRDPVTLL